MQILSVVGARPQFVKLAPIAKVFASQGDISHTIVHTGQHYDPEMSEAFFEGLEIPHPDENLEIGSGSHGIQTGRMLAELDATFEKLQPDLVLVYGDTNSTLAGAIAAVKMQIPVAHLEAGLRSFNRAMPEEHNRILTDHASDLLLAPTPVAKDHLEREGLGDRVQVVGDVMTDVCFRTLELVKHKLAELPTAIDPNSPFILTTIHRAENTDNPTRLNSIVKALQSLPLPVYLLTHPRLLSRANSFSIQLSGGSVSAGAPLPYEKLISVLSRSSGIVTDSGGLQKEAYLLGKLCTTIRSETEWTETLNDDWNVLAPDIQDLDALVMRNQPNTEQIPYYGDGNTAYAVLQSLRRFLEGRTW